MMERSEAYLKRRICAKDGLTDLEGFLVVGNHPLNKKGSYMLEDRLYLGSILFTTSSGNQEKSPLIKFKEDT